MKKVLYILLLICFIFLVTNKVEAKDINYKTCFNYVKEVKVSKYFVVDEMYYYIIDSKSDKVIMTMLDSSKVIYCNTEKGVNLRHCPNTKSGRYSVIPYRYGVIELGRSNGWSLIYINNSYYFVWNHLFTTNRKNSKSVLHTIKENPFPERIYLGKWIVTEYCIKCNTGGYRVTASGHAAEEGRTCAVSFSNYKNLKGKWIYVEGWGKFRVEDYGSVHGCDKNEWVDLFLDDSYHNRVWTKADVYIVDE